MATRTFPTDNNAMAWRPDKHIPITPMQALMETAPFTEPDESMLEKQDRLEPFRALLESGALTDRELHVIYGIFWRGRSLAELGVELDLVKSSVFRLRESAFDKLRTMYDPELGALTDGPGTVGTIGTVGKHHPTEELL